MRTPSQINMSKCKITIPFRTKMFMIIGLIFVFASCQA